MKEMKKLKLYLETTVWNFVFADDDLEKQRVTRDFLDWIAGAEAEIYISELVIGEFNKAQKGRENCWNC